MNGVASWCPDVLCALKLRRPFWRGSVRDLGNAERQPPTFVAVSVQARMELKIRDRVQQGLVYDPVWAPTLPQKTHFNSKMIGSSTKIAIDDTILKRLEVLMPSYQTRKPYINMLLDEAATRLENQHRAQADEWDN